MTAVPIPLPPPLSAQVVDSARLRFYRKVKSIKLKELMTEIG
jgi:hypothetical protein